MCSSCGSDPVSPFSFQLTASFLLFLSFSFSTSYLWCCLAVHPRPGPSARLHVLGVCAHGCVNTCAFTCVLIKCLHVCVCALLFDVYACVWMCSSARACVCVPTAMQPSGAGASLSDSWDLAALAMGHASTRQEEVATALCHFPHPHPFLFHFPYLLDSISLV